VTAAPVPAAIPGAVSGAVILNRHNTHRVLRGHCWVYVTEVERVEGAPVAGDVVAVRDAGGRAVAWGFYNPQSKIRVRVLTRSERPIDDTFLRERLVAAIAHRDAVLPGRPARRLVSSEADLLPGLIVDQYGDTLVVQATSAGIDRRLAGITALLVELVRPAAVIERNDVGVRRLEGLPLRTGVLHGVAPGAIRVRVGRADFPCDPLDAHKTGLYLDQQASWEQVAAYVRPGDRVLDAFCHLGGFGVHALLAGASGALALDSAEASIAGARQAAAWAGVGERFEARCGDAFAALKALDAANERFQLAVVDPPSFTRTRDAVPGALRGYKELHLRALRMLAPGGVLATFTCSHHISAEAFLATVIDAAVDAKRTVRREAVLGASPDHPVLPAVPETEYLKGFVLRVVDG
jgi:23S rRNA (cytosine1962-C5)-methyltransferase